MGEYLVSRNETIVLGVDYSNYLRELEEGLLRLQSAIGDLCSMASFRGATAQSIQWYMEDRHSLIISSLKALGRQICYDYAPYFDSLEDVDGAVSAMIDGESLVKAGLYLGGHVTRKLDEVEQSLRQCSSWLEEAGFSAHVPSMAAHRILCEQEGRKLTDADAGVLAAESACVARFTAPREETRALNEMVVSTLAILRTGGGTATNYQRGFFSQSEEAKELRSALDKVEQYQTIHKDEVVQVQKNMYSDNVSRLNALIEEQTDKKSTWVSIYTATRFVKFVFDTYKVVSEPDFGSVTGELSSVVNLYFAVSYYKSACFDRDPMAAEADSADLINSLFKISKYSKDMYDMGELLHETGISHSDMTDDVEIGDVAHSPAMGHVKKKVVGDFTEWVMRKLGAGDSETALAGSWAQAGFDFFSKFYGSDPTGDIFDANDLANDLIVAPVEYKIAKTQEKIDGYQGEIYESQANAAYYDAW